MTATSACGAPYPPARTRWHRDFGCGCVLVMEEYDHERYDREYDIVVTMEFQNRCPRHEHCPDVAIMSDGEYKAVEECEDEDPEDVIISPVDLVELAVIARLDFSFLG